jgi:hypothetical protein
MSYYSEHKSKRQDYLNSHKKEILEYRNSHKKEILEYRNSHKKEILEYRNSHKKEIRAGWLKRTYGITQEEYNIQLDKQNGRCAICGKHSSDFKINLAVDHNHETGKTRGILCSHCNRLLGYSKEDVDVLEKAIAYIKMYN